MKNNFIALLLAMVIGIAPIAMQAQIVDRDLTNLVIFMRFADDEEITHPFNQIDTMFNGKAPGYLSVANFYNTMTYGHINYNTVYTNNIQNGQIVSYQDVQPRGYFEPYSPSNPIGYQGELPFMGICRREAELLARAFRYVDSLHLVDDDVVLDGDNDGYIDNVSFVVKGNVGEWASILWPHMEYFPHDSIDHPVEINGIKPNTFNLEFEGEPIYFTAHVFRHEMGHSLNLPDLYHYIHYTDVSPAGSWDMMCYNYGANHTAAIYKNKILHVADDPIQITHDGDYTLKSVGSSQSQNCYYIKSAIDSTQWYVLEYRNKQDLFDESIPEIRSMTLEIGGFLQGHVIYTLSVCEGNVVQSVEDYAFSSFKETADGSNMEYTTEEFIEAVRDLHLGEWRKSYTTEHFGIVVLDGTQWSMKIDYGGKLKPIVFEGDNAFPYNFEQVKELFGISDR